MKSSSNDDDHRWRFVTNHAHVSLGQVAGLVEVVDDQRRCSFSDPGGVGEVAQSCFRGGGDGDEHAALVGEQPTNGVVQFRSLTSCFELLKSLHWHWE